MSEPNKMDSYFLDVVVSAYLSQVDDCETTWERFLGEALPIVASYRESIEAPLNARIEELEAQLAAERAKRERILAAINNLIYEYEAVDPMPDAPKYSIKVIAQGLRSKHCKRLRNMIAALDAEKGE